MNQYLLLVDDFINDIKYFQEFADLEAARKEAIRYTRCHYSVEIVEFKRVDVYVID